MAASAAAAEVAAAPTRGGDTILSDWGGRAVPAALGLDSKPQVLAAKEAALGTEAPRKLEELRGYLEARGAGANVLAGWRAYERTYSKPGGDERPQNFYYNPEGQVFNSKPKVAKHLGLGA